MKRYAKDCFLLVLAILVSGFSLSCDKPGGEPNVELVFQFTAAQTAASPPNAREGELGENLPERDEAKTPGDNLADSETDNATLPFEKKLALIRKRLERAEITITGRAMEAAVVSADIEPTTETIALSAEVSPGLKRLFDATIYGSEGKPLLKGRTISDVLPSQENLVVISLGFTPEGDRLVKDILEGKIIGDDDDDDDDAPEKRETLSSIVAESGERVDLWVEVPKTSFLNGEVTWEQTVGPPIEIVEEGETPLGTVVRIAAYFDAPPVNAVRRFVIVARIKSRLLDVESTFDIAVLSNKNLNSTVEIIRPKDGEKIDIEKDSDLAVEGIQYNLVAVAVNWREGEQVFFYIDGELAGKAEIEPSNATGYLIGSGDTSGDKLPDSADIGDTQPDKVDPENIVIKGKVGKANFVATLEEGKRAITAEIVDERGKTIKSHINVGVGNTVLTDTLGFLKYPETKVRGLFGMNVDADKNLKNGVQFPIELVTRNTLPGDRVELKIYETSIEYANTTKLEVKRPDETFKIPLDLLEGYYMAELFIYRGEEELFNDADYLEIDTTPPFLEFSNLEEIGSIANDAAKDTAGYQRDFILYSSDISEGEEIALNVGGVLVSRAKMIGGKASFLKTTLPEGNLIIAATGNDDAGNEGKTVLQMVVDITPPGKPRLDFEILNNRACSGKLNLIGSADDGDNGEPVTNYKIFTQQKDKPETRTPQDELEDSVLPGTAVNIELTDLTLYRKETIIVEAFDKVGNMTSAELDFECVLNKKIFSKGEGTNFGGSATFGRINDDSLSDLIIGAPDSFSGDGRVYILQGNKNPSTLDERSFVELFPPKGESGGNFGTYVEWSNAADLDYPQLIVSSPKASAGAGNVHIFPISDDAVNTLGGKEILPHKSIMGNLKANLGERITAKADLNEDGIPDLVISAPKESRDNFSDAGGIYIFNEPSLFAEQGGIASMLNVSSRIMGLATGDALGKEIVSLKNSGGLSSEMYDLLAVSAPTTSGEGKVYIVEKLKGIIRNALLSPGDGHVKTLAPPAGNALQFGDDLLPYDLDYDGRDDLIVVDGKGRLFVYFTDEKGLPETPNEIFSPSQTEYIGGGVLPDLRNSGYATLCRGTADKRLEFGFLQGRELSTADFVTIESEIDVETCIGIGDFNGDGYEDILIANPTAGKIAILY